MSVNITDKKLLVVCDLLNLKIEFASLVKQTLQSGTKIIHTNHTIYSLIEEELKGIEKRSAILEKRDEEIVKSLKGIEKTSGGIDEKATEKQLDSYHKIMEEYRKKIKEIEKSSKKYGSFYLERKNKTKKYSYINKRDLQKNAPILMEYYDRYQYGCEESKFLDEWEVIYGGDYYELMIDYMMRFENELSKIHKNNSTIINRTDKYQYKIDNYIAFREELEERIAKINTYSRVFNFMFDSITTHLGIAGFGKYFSNKSTRMVVDKISQAIAEPVGNMVLTKTAGEIITNENTIENLVTSFSGKKVLSLIPTVSLKLLGIRVVIVKKKETNDFIVGFYSDDNEIMEQLKKGVLSLDIPTFNVVIESCIKERISGETEVNVYYTGYGNGAILSTSAFLMLNLEERDINYYNKVFIGEEEPDILSLINFDIYDIENITPGAISYSVDITQDFKNLLQAIYTNAMLTDGAGVIVPVLLKRSILGGVSTAFVNVGVPIYVLLIVIYLGYSMWNRARLKNIEKNFIENRIIIKDGYFKINEEIFNYDISSAYNLDFEKLTFIIPDGESEENITLSIARTPKQFKEEIEQLAEVIAKRNEKKEKRLIEIEINGKKLYLPLDIAILLLKEGELCEYYGENIYEITPEVICVVDDKGRFKAGMRKSEYKLEENLYVNLIPLNTAVEMDMLTMLNYVFQVQKKYNEQENKIERCEFIYFDGELNEEDKKFLDDVTRGKYCYNSEKKLTEKKIKIDKKFDKDTMVIEEKNKTKNKITEYPYDIKVYRLFYKVNPRKTEKISDIKGIKTLNLPVSEYVYFPYIKNGMISEDINENYVGSLMRSLYRNEIKYDALNEGKKDAEFENYPIYGGENKKNKGLSDYFIQQLRLNGYKYCMWIHYNNVLKLLEKKSYSSRLELIERFYDIKVEDERKKGANLKIGILENGEYSKKEIGYIYGDDKISGRAIDLNYYYGYGLNIEDVESYGVCDNAILKCSCGSMLGVLEVNSQKFEYTDGYLDATEKDKKTKGFIECTNRKEGCSPALKEWKGVSEGIEIDGKRCLLSTSEIECEYKGVIKIVEPNCKVKLK